MSIKISVPSTTHDLKPRIAVVGVGGAGGNAINNMIQSQLEGVDFIVANTDAQALAGSRTDRRIQLGVTITQGLGAGSRPDVAPQVQCDARRAGRRRVDRSERQVGGAAQLKAATGQQDGEGNCESGAHQTTMLMSLPGTTMIFRMACSPMYFFIRSLARTSSSSPCWSSAFGALSAPFFLPLI